MKSLFFLLTLTMGFAKTHFVESEVNTSSLTETEVLPSEKGALSDLLHSSPPPILTHINIAGTVHPQNEVIKEMRERLLVSGEDILEATLHYNAVLGLLQKDIFDNATQENLEKHFNKFMAISDRVVGPDTVKFKLCFKIGVAYNELKTDKGDEKAVYYLNKALQVSEAFPEAVVDRDILYLYFARINYRKGNYSLAKMQFQQYRGEFNPFIKESYHRFLGPICCTLHIKIQCLLPSFLTEAGSIFRSQVFCFLNLAFVGKLVYDIYVKNYKKNCFPNVQTYPYSPINGLVDHLTVSAQGMVIFVNKKKLYLWNTRKPANDARAIVATSAPSYHIQKICSWDSFFVILCRDQMMILNMHNHQAVLQYSLEKISLIDMVVLPSGKLVYLKKKDTEEVSTLHVIDIAKEIAATQKDTGREATKEKKSAKNTIIEDKKVITAFSIGILSLDLDSLGDRIAIVGSTYIYFDFFNIFLQPGSILDAYCHACNVVIPSVIESFIVRYIGVSSSIHRISNVHGKVKKARFSWDRKKLAVGGLKGGKVYDIQNIKKPILLYRYSLPFSKISELKWADDDLILYMTGRSKGQTDDDTLLFLMPTSPQSLLKKCLKKAFQSKERGMYLLNSHSRVLRLTFDQGRVALLIKRFYRDKKVLYYASSYKISQEAVKQSAHFISFTWFFLAFLSSLLCFENSVYYG